MTAVGRRRVMRIAAAATILGVVPRTVRQPERMLEWTGAAFGTQVRIVLHHDDSAAAARVIEACVGEIGRLENEFSLFRPHSALSALNRDGRLERPSQEMYRLMTQAVAFGALTDGMFDVTVQPLWQLLAQTQGLPEAAALAAACRLADYRDVEVEAARIAFARPGMAVTLNGIAQGYATDRIADLLRGHGFGHVLVDIGEVRALDGRADGRPWRIRLNHGGAAAPEIDLNDRAVATSCGGASPFTPDGSVNHLVDPRRGTSPIPTRVVSVVARDAATADALSTALILMPQPPSPAVLQASGVDRILVSDAGRSA